jgi:hypothetical protein
VDFVIDGIRRELDIEIIRRAVHGHAPERVRTHWVDVDGVRWPPKQVLALATGLDRDGFTSHRALGVLGRLGLTTSPWTRSDGSTARAPSRHRERRPATGTLAGVDVVLVGCSSSKAASPRPARELFTGTAFTKARDRAEASGLPWYVLSAEHGLLEPDEPVAPYDRYLPDTSRDYRAAWASRVVAQLAERHDLRGLVVEAHAGRAYCEPLVQPLGEAGATLLQPLAGLGQGERLAWYGRPVEGSSAGVVPDIDVLLDPAAAESPADFLAAGRAASNEPGLYSWWADDAGAADLTRGLGHEVAPGLVYAGRAGGIRPSGVRSTNTLWGRIATMHLGGRRQFSTFRLTLSACLSPEGGPAVDEQDLTAWMYRHLRVAVLPLLIESVAPGEERLLERADPPLNLRDVPRNELRRALTRRRKVLPT